MAKNCPKVSVLVPIYNVEQYLRQCLQSLRDQTLDDMEIICINDGSTDGSLEIIKEFLGKDKRFRLIDKENSGYGDSMNQGLKAARGEYIGIVESDDWVDKEAFGELYEIAKANDADVVRANFYHNKVGKDEKARLIPVHETGRVINPRQHTWLFLQSPAIWASIYKREFLEKNKINFLATPGASYQDTSFAFKVLAAAKRVCLTTKAYLHYRVDNANSSINSPGKVFCVCDEYAEIERYLKEIEAYEDLGFVMWTAKCSIYLWNALRLRPKLVKEFYTKVAPEIMEANRQGLIFIDFFGETPLAKATEALTHGRVGVACRIVTREQKRIRRAKKLENSKFRPHRAKELKIARQIAILEAQNEDLEQKIHSIEQKMEQKNETK